MPRRGVAVAIVGADAMGKANDEEVRGDAEEVTQRRSEAPRRLRRRTVAIQALLDEIKLVGKPVPVSAAALAADRTAVQKKGGIAAKTAAKVATDEHSLDQFQCVDVYQQICHCDATVCGVSVRDCSLGCRQCRWFILK